ncbi:MAG: response regulator transcription factor, partial [Ottowia sp.]|nr:response regulator transcription factor [Ottowia sp.]
MIHVLLCDDHLIVREGLKQVLAEDANVRVVAEASSAEEMLAQVLPLRERGQLDVVLLDIALPGQDGLGALQALRASWPDLPVLILSTYPER